MYKILKCGVGVLFLFEKENMIGEREDLIQELKNQVHLLMAKYSTLKKEYSQMLLENESLLERANEQKIEIETLEQQYSTAKMATGVLAKEVDVDVARTEINRIVREIDDCIALLNR